jgi:hypothetical protein
MDIGKWTTINPSVPQLLMMTAMDVLPGSFPLPIQRHLLDIRCLCHHHIIALPNMQK